MLHLKRELNDREETEIELDWIKSFVPFAVQLEKKKPSKSIIHVPGNLTLPVG